MPRPPVPSVPPWIPLQQLGLVGAMALSFAVLWWHARPGGEWGSGLRRRFVLGVPWGTFLTALAVLAVYLLVQNGLSHWFRPTVLPYRSWSYFYPLGILTAAFAHAGPGHLTGNLIGTLALAPVAEYAWGHFPTARGSQTFTSFRTNPYARILAVPCVAFLVGVASSLFALGPAIGFSGVVFAFAGFALVNYPITTVIALVGSRVVGLVDRALRTPTTVSTVEPSVSVPWWADVAIQGHALGLLVGVALGLAVVHLRDRRPSAARLWFAALILAVHQSLWAVYVPRGEGTFVLFRAAGTALVFLLAALVTAGILASDRPLVPAIDLDRREAAVGLLLATLAALAGVAIPFNALIVSGATAGGDGGVQVRDYTVVYDEDVPNRLVSAVDVSLLGGEPTVNESGVIVISDRREIWWVSVRKSRLAFAGRAAVRLGGPGWRRTVVANRTGWSAVGGNTSYKVYLRPPDGDRRLAYTSGPAPAEPIVAGRNLTIEPADRGFAVRVTRGNETLDRARLPANGGNRSVGGLVLRRTNGSLFASIDGTRVRVATRETYRGRE